MMARKQLLGWLGGLWLLLTSCQNLPPTEAAQTALDQFIATTSGPGRWAVDRHGRWKLGRLTIVGALFSLSPAGLPTGAPRTVAAKLHMDKLSDERGHAYRFGPKSEDGPNNVDIGLAWFEQTDTGDWHLTHLMLPLPNDEGGTAKLLEFWPRIRLE